MNKQNLIQTGLRRLTNTGLTLISYCLPIPHLFQVVAVSLFMLALPAAAQASSGAGTLGSGRLLPSMAALAGLIGVIIGRRALARPAQGRSRAIVAIVLGMISLLIGGFHAANSAGGFGTGNGLAGAIAAIVLGMISVALGGLALSRFLPDQNGQPS